MAFTRKRLTRCSKQLSFTPTHKLLLRWVNLLEIEAPVTSSDLPQRFRKGVFPLKLLERIDPDFEISKEFLNPRSREDCLNNLQTLVNYLSSKGHFKFDIQSLYRGSASQAWDCLEFMFRRVLVKEVKNFKQELVAWYNNILIQYSVEVISEEVYLNELGDGVKLSVVLHYLVNGFEKPLEGINWNPSTYKQRKENVELMFEMLKKTKALVLFSVEEFLNLMDNDFLLLQLFYLYIEFKNTQESLDFSFQCPEGPRESDPPLDIMLNQIIYQERKLMFLADQRAKREAFNNKKLKRSPSLEQLSSASSLPVFSHSPSEMNLSHAESLVCYLLTPRLIQITQGPKQSRVLMNIVPNESKFSVKEESYVLEWKDLESFSVIGRIEIREISEVSKVKSNCLKIAYGAEEIILNCKSSSECEHFHQAVSYLLSKHRSTLL